MSLIEVGSELVYRVNTPTSFLFNIAPARTEHQSLRRETVTLSPDVGYQECAVGDEQNRLFRLQAEPGQLTLVYRAVVMLKPVLDDPPEIEETGHAELPGDVLPYLSPSRYCESDRLSQYALQEFGELAPGFSRVTAICNWIYEHFDYVPGTTDARSGACDVLIQRTGVCRDYAHLGIALCRALCIPARYVSGYSVGLDPPDFHGFFEAYLGGAWYLFDATRMAPTHGLVRIGVGRDAADASFATIIGAAFLERMEVTAKEITSEIPDQPTSDEPAISTV
jgi:transglutaminase-like putative cysteine protease